MLLTFCDKDMTIAMAISEPTKADTTSTSELMLTPLPSKNTIDKATNSLAEEDIPRT